MWIEIFKGGKQMDSKGREHDGDRFIDKAVTSFDEKIHRPPLVLGHPRDNSPAYGWVNGLKATVVDGARSLLADIAPVEPLKEWVNAGLYRNRSASFYPDGRLRHVGFLGGQPPAVKGLSPLPAFADEDEALEFIDGWQQGILARVLRRLREYFIEKDGAEAADRLLPDYEIEEIGRVPEEAEAEPALYTEPQPKGGSMKFSEFMDAINLFKKFGGKDEDIDQILPVAPAAGNASFTETDLETARREAAEQAKKDAAAEFAEAESKRRKKARAGKIKEFLEAGVKAGKIAPAWVKAGMGQFMEQLADEADAVIEFSEGDEKKTPDAWFREFLEGLPKLVEFSEIATRDTEPGDDGDLEKREKLISDFMESEQVGYKEALLAVSEKHPDLFPRP